MHIIMISTEINPSMQITDIHDRWKADCVIAGDLSKATHHNATLHHKYMEYHNNARANLALLGDREKEVRLLKWKYYNGQMTKDEMDRLGWPYDPYNGSVRPPKNIIGQYIDADPDMRELANQIEYQKMILDTTRDILDMVRFRHTQIRNILDWQKFQAGY